LAAALGRPAPAPLDEVQRHTFEVAQDRADDDAMRIYGRRGQAAA
jgi:hypothetical protein